MMNFSSHNLLQGNLLKGIQQTFSPFPTSRICLKENAIEINVPELPYIFYIKCCDVFGWSVFLLSKNLDFDLPDNCATTHLYEQLEIYLDQLNFLEFDLVDKEKELVCSRFQMLEMFVQEIIDHYPTVIHQVRYKGPSVLRLFLHIPEMIFTKPSIEIGYSRIMNRWYMDISRSKGVEQTRLYELLPGFHEKIARCLIEWNLSFLPRALS
ncbi:hypothetical protein SMD22_00635 (plasmid) [Brevibacillus halotolerans]|nr:hypothetical protein SMD22_00635 [Brevibacillus halotolerans]